MITLVWSIASMSLSDSRIPWVQHVPASPEIIELSSTDVGEAVDLPPVVEDVPALAARKLSSADNDDDCTFMDSVESPYNPRGLVEPSSIPESSVRPSDHTIPFTMGFRLDSWYPRTHLGLIVSPILAQSL